MDNIERELSNQVLKSLLTEAFNINSLTQNGIDLVNNYINKLVEELDECDFKNILEKFT